MIPFKQNQTDNKKEIVKRIKLLHDLTLKTSGIYLPIR